MSIKKLFLCSNKYVFHIKSKLILIFIFHFEFITLLIIFEKLI